jgi:hypothetical protein
MKTEISRFVAVASTLGLLASGGQTGFLERQSDNMSGATQSTSTFADHDIVKRYKNTAFSSFLVFSLNLSIKEIEYPAPVELTTSGFQQANAYIGVL